jgi:thiamine-phosphate pyrophosphorylase
MNRRAVHAASDGPLRQAVLEHYGESFGVDDKPWQAWRLADAPAQPGAHDVLLADGEADENMIARVTAAGATLIATDREGGQWIDTVRSPMGTWVFSVAADTGQPHSPAFVAVLLACLSLHFPAHDALCLARAWEPGSADWPSDFARFPHVRHPALMPPEQAATPFAPCPALGLYVVVPTAGWIERLAPLNVPTVQLRFKSGDPAAVRAEIARAAKAMQGSASRLFINDHWQAAIDYRAANGGEQSGLYGIHLGQEDLEDADLDAIRAAGLRLGVSTHGYAEMLRVAAIRPSYLALGAIFPTTTKTMPTAPQGMGRFRAYARLMQPVIPSLVGIGGVNAANMREVLAVGVGSAAVVRAVTEADDVPAAVAHLMSLFPAA